jgi:hypothetical protein
MAFFLRELDSVVETEVRLDCMGGFVVTKDRDDVKYLAKTVPLDLEVLRQRYQKELRWQLASPEREDLTLRLWIEAIEEEREV